MNEIVSAANQFHFLRPLWLLSVLPALWLVWLFWRQKNSAVNWRGAINEHLIEHLLDSGNKNTVRWPWFVLLCTWILAAIAIAGPTWEKLPQPVLQKQDALVIILDLSLSMHAEDIKPSRLIRARYKTLDILNKRDEGLTALIAYSGDAHIVSPLTDDNATVANLLPALSPEMMPVYGSDPVSALQLARQLFKNSGLNEGRILLLTDGVTDKDIKDVSDSISRNGFTLSILGIGTTQGAPIPTRSGFIKDDNGKIVVPQLPRQQLDKLASVNDGRYTDVNLGDNDIEFLLPPPLATRNQNTTLSEREFDQWNDRGYLLALFLLPIALLAFRRGWLLILPLVILIEPQNSYAFEWKDLWQTPDQQAAKSLNDGDPKKAAELFKDKQWQAAAQYKAENYEAATQNLNQFDHADAHYNRGNALAKAGKFDDAIDAYHQALKHQPDMEDAQFNKELLEKLKEQQQNQQQQNSSDQNNDENSDSEQSENKNKQDQQGNESKPQDQDNNENSQNSDSQDNSDNSSQDNNDGAELPEEKDSRDESSQNKDQQETQSPEQKQAESEQKDQAAEQPENKQPQAKAEMTPSDKENQHKQQAIEQWLRQIPDEPSGLLRRKFDYEHRLRQRNQKQNPREQPKW